MAIRRRRRRWPAGESGELGHLGQGHAEDSRRVEHSGVGDLEAVAGRLGQGSGQELLTGATDRCREGVQRTGAAALAGAVPTFTALECASRVRTPDKRSPAA